MRVYIIRTLLIKEGEMAEKQDIEKEVVLYSLPT
jgi:hypothetical protein